VKEQRSREELGHGASGHRRKGEANGRGSGWVSGVELLGRGKGQDAS
jgi:hypothetical protein